MADLKTLCIDGRCMDVDLSPYLKIEDLVDSVYPVGSTIIMPTNTNPNTIYPGTTWTLYNKGLASRYYTIDDLGSAFTYNTSYMTGVSIYVYVNGETVTIGLSFKNARALGYWNTQVGSLNPNAIGLNNFRECVMIIDCRANNTGIGRGLIQNGGEITIYDWTTRSTSYPTTTNVSCVTTITTAIEKERMIDSFCDKFYFRRTA